MKIQSKSRARLSRVGLLVPVAVLLGACGGQIPFSGTAKTVMGDPPPLPPPPPPPPPPKPEPPKPPPRVEVRDNKIEIKEKIQFEVSKATIKEESFGLLNEIGDVFKENPHILLVAIEGHASKEGAAAFNRKLSDDRAKAVRQYLVDHGVDGARMTAKGYGFDKPIASNDTEEGREANRRVEFNIVKQDITKKKVEIDPTTGKEKVVEEKTITEQKEVEPPADEKKADEKKPAAPKADEKKPAAPKADEKKAPVMEPKK